MGDVCASTVSLPTGTPNVCGVHTLTHTREGGC